MGTWQCSICGKNIRYKNGYVERNGSDPMRLRSIRRHYKQDHPSRFKAIWIDRRRLKPRKKYKHKSRIGKRHRRSQKSAFL